MFNIAGSFGASLAPYAATWLAQRYGLQYVATICRPPPSCRSLDYSRYARRKTSGYEADPARHLRAGHGDGRLFGRAPPQTDARRIAEQQDAAEIVPKRCDAERRPELSRRQEHQDRDGKGDARIRRDRRPPAAHVGNDPSPDERRAPIRQRQPKHGVGVRRDRGLHLSRRGGRELRIGEALVELARDGVGVEPDAFGVRAD